MMTAYASLSSIITIIFGIYGCSQSHVYGKCRIFPSRSWDCSTERLKLMMSKTYQRSAEAQLGSQRLDRCMNSHSIDFGLQGFLKGENSNLWYCKNPVSGIAYLYRFVPAFCIMWMQSDNRLCGAYVISSENVPMTSWKFVAHMTDTLRKLF